MKTPSNQKGQVAVEYILVMAVLVAVSLFVTQQIRKNQVIGQFVERPWGTLANVIENGVTIGSSADHPNLRKRHLSLKGDPL